MGANSKLFWILTAYFAVLTVVYSGWAMFYNPQGTGIEPAGSVGLLLAAIASGLIAFYVGRTHKAQGGELPQDLADANIDDGDPEQGFYSPWSWWPVTLAAGLAIVFLGLAVGPWLSLLGGPILLIALVGWVYEYYRGNFSR